MKSTLWWLGLIFGTLSVVMLIKHGFNYGFVAPLQMVIEFYQQATQVLFGWAEPWIRLQLAAWRDWIGFDLQLHPHWRDVFVLLFIYFGADARTSYAFGNKGSMWFRIILGFVVAAIAAILSGAIPVEPQNPSHGFAIAAVAIVGMGIFDIFECAWQARWFREEVESWWAAFNKRAVELVARLTLGLALGFVGLQVPIIQGLANPGLALLGLFVITTALWWIVWGARHANKSRAAGEGWVSGFLRRGGTRVGIAMLGSFIGAALFLLINAGLKLADL